MRAYTIAVLHKFENSIECFNVETGQSIFKLPTREFPHEMCLSPDGKRLYVTEYGLRGVESVGLGGNTIGVFDVRRRERISTICTGDYNRPHGIVAHRLGRLFVTSEPTQSLLIYDLNTEELLHAVNTEQECPHITNVAPDGRTVYAANVISNSLTAIDVESGRIVKQIPVLNRPEGMAFSPDGALIYVVNRESRAIAIVNTSDLNMIDRIETGDGPVRIVITLDGKTIAFPLFHQHAVQIADTQSRKVTQTITVGRQPAGTTMSEDGRLLFVSCELERCVYVISMETYEVVNRIQTGNGPDSMVCLNTADLNGEHEQ